MLRAKKMIAVAIGAGLSLTVPTFARESRGTPSGHTGRPAAAAHETQGRTGRTGRTVTRESRTVTRESRTSGQRSTDRGTRGERSHADVQRGEAYSSRRDTGRTYRDVRADHRDGHAAYRGGHDDQAFRVRRGYVRFDRPLHIGGHDLSHWYFDRNHHRVWDCDRSVWIDVAPDWTCPYPLDVAPVYPGVGEVDTPLSIAAVPPQVLDALGANGFGQIQSVTMVCRDGGTFYRCVVNGRRGALDVRVDVQGRILSVEAY